MTYNETKKLAKKNAKALQIGDMVDYHSIIGGPVTSGNHEIEHGPEVIGETPCFWLSDKTGCVSAAALTRMEN